MLDIPNLLEQESAFVASPGFTWQSAGQSAAGKVRKLNEDAFINAPMRGLWAVADGMGGHARGDYASGVVVESLLHMAEQKNLALRLRDMEERLVEAHQNCRNSFKGERVGSTVAVMYAYGAYGFFVWAGDSRVYRWRQGQMTLLTQDHSLAQEKCANGELTQSQALVHPSANVLTRAVGVHQTLHLDVCYHPVEVGDRYLLCSDGLYNDVRFEDIAERLGGGSLDSAVAALIDCALDNGGRDNITVLVTEAVNPVLP